MNFKDFMNIFFTMDYFLILLIILLLILLVIALQLIKNQYTNKNSEEEINEKNDTLDNLFIDFMSKPEVKTVPVNEEQFTNEINYYEKDEEECAIISSEELEKISKIRNINTNSNLINQYEMEQEKKAIISYEELLKNASNLKMNYEDVYINEDGPVIKKIDVETPTLERNLSYIDETSFLTTLKEFRANLK